MFRLRSTATVGPLQSTKVSMFSDLNGYTIDFSLVKEFTDGGSETVKEGSMFCYVQMRNYSSIKESEFIVGLE